MKRTALILAIAALLLALAALLHPPPRPLQSLPSTPAAAPTHGLNLVVVIDRQLPVDRLTLVRDACRELVAALAPDDRLGFIAAGDDVLTQSGSYEVGAGTFYLRKWLDGLEAGTGTIEIGLGPPLQMADGLLDLTQAGARAPRIVLVSDGVHVPGILSNAELRALVIDLKRRGVRVDALSPDKPLARPPLEALAELGGGRLLVLHLATDVRALLVDPR